MGKWAITLNAWLAASLWLPVVHAAEDNLYFSGTLVNEPCALAEEDQLVELDFKTVVDKDLYLNGRTVGRPIELHLQNCDLGTGQRSVSITFNGNESSDPAGLLLVQSATVKGLMVGLETPAGKALPLNKIHRMGDLSSGSYQISFHAYLQGKAEVLANRALGQGDFDASLTFALTYE